jgi:RHS repeat-associated protein
VRPLRLLLGAALIAISAAPLSAGRFVPADAPATAFGRYRVSLDTMRIDDPDAAVTQLLSICHCRVEPYAEEGFTGFLISATPSAARMLSSDPRVSAVEELVSEAAAVIPSVERGTWAGGATESAPRTEPVAMAAPHNPVSNAGITAWDTGTYTYDGSGNIRSIGTTQIYTYDLYGRLAYGKVQASRFQRFSYDRFGNLLNTTTNTDTPPAPQTISGVSNRLSSGGATYDAAGRMLTGTGVAFRYDGDGMPTWSQMAAGSVTETKVQIYSATNERIASLWIGPANGSDWTIRDAGGQVLRRLHKSTSGQWSWQEDYVYRDGQMLASEVATREKTLHYHLDHLGTPRLITGNGGAQVALHTYDPFGAEVTAANQAGTEPIKKFTGHERDTANVDYMHARYYQNGWGRFLSVDPENGSPQSPQSWNLYTYSLDNPVMFTDRDGRSATLAGGLIGGAIGGGIALWQGKSWREVGAAAAGGAVAGALMGSVIDTGGASLGVMLGAGALSGAAGAMTENVVLGRPHTVGNVAPGAIAGTAGVMLGASVGPAMEAVASRMGGFSRGTVAEMSGMLRDAARGKGNFGIGSGSAREANAMGKAWVGENYKIASDGKTLVSSDGLRQYRPPSYKPNLQKVQANFEGRVVADGQWQSNGHLDVRQ